MRVEPALLVGDAANGRVLDIASGAAEPVGRWMVLHVAGGVGKAAGAGDAVIADVIEAVNNVGCSAVRRGLKVVNWTETAMFSLI
jgi:hypothetical protein